MSEVWERAYRVELEEEGRPGEAVTTAGAEASRQWRGNEVTLTYADQSMQSAMVGKDGIAIFINPSWWQAVIKLEVRRLGPDAMPSRWITNAIDLATFKPGAKVTVTIRARLRHSAWLAGSSLFAGASGAKANVDPTITTNTKTLDALKDHLDDLSFLETLTVGNPRAKVAAEQVHWHAGYVRGIQNVAGDSHYRHRGCVAFSRQVIADAHARGLQVLAGYEIVGTGKTNTEEGKTFRAWFEKATPAEIIAHADAIYEMLWVKGGLDFDGIGFDLEIAGFNPPTENVRLLYHRMADLLAPDNRMVTYATATFTVDGQTGQEASHLRSQPFWLARDKPNLIARPMGYDGGEGYHAESIACALETVKLHPSQFQMGVKLVNSRKLGLSGTLGDVAVQQRCREIYTPNRVGLIGFALDGGTNFDAPMAAKPRGVQTYFEPLNPGQTRASVRGQPLQCPLRSNAT